MFARAPELPSQFRRSHFPPRPVLRERVGVRASFADGLRGRAAYIGFLIKCETPPAISAPSSGPTTGTHA